MAAMHSIPAFSSAGDGPIILMLHGIGGGRISFTPQLASYSKAGYRAVAWDMPGYGDSAPIDPYDFPGLAQACIALIERLLQEQGEGRSTGVALLGHSIGGMVAQEVVARRPELVERLVLCGTSPAFGKAGGDWQRTFLAQRTAPLDKGVGMAELARSLVPQMTGPQANAAGVEMAIQCMEQVSPATYRRALEALVTFDRRSALASIRVPALLVASECDRNAPPSVMRKMAQAISGSALVELDGIGHLQNLEAPERFDDVVLDFLSRSSWGSA